nr:ABC transporter substrate-binding protein [Microbacterium bovistercoris]
MFRWKAPAATAAVIAAAALVLAGCSSGASDDTSGNASGGTLTLGAIVAPQTFDPAGAQWGNASPFYQAVYDTLILMKPDGTVAPMLATKWVYNDDDTVLTLTIRDDVTFTDGSKLTADVVRENLQRFKDGTSPDAAGLAGVKSIEAPDDTTVVLTLDAPDPALLNNLSRDAGLVGSAKSLTAADLATNPVGSGPYELDTKATVTGTSYTYTKNPDYWNKDLQHYDKLVINVYSDPTAALNAIKGGAANAVKLASNDSLSEVEAAGWTVNKNELDFQGLMLYDRAGTMNKALGNVKVRQAINMAFDRAALLKAVGGGYGTVTEQVFPESSVGFDKALDTTYSYDPAGAKQLLADAGYPNGFTLEMPSTSLLGSNTFNLLAQQLKDIGITVKYTDSGTNYITDMLAPKFPAAFMALEQNPDWQLIQFMISPTASWNPFHYSDDTANGYIAKIQNGDEAAVKDLNKYIVDQAWFAPLYRVQGSVASDANTSVKMLVTNAFPAIYDFTPKS